MNAYLIGQMALLRLEQGRYEDARVEFQRYFAVSEGVETAADPEHVQIYDAYSRLREILEDTPD